MEVIWFVMPSFQNKNERHVENMPQRFQYFWWINPLISANLQAACVSFIKLLSAQNPDLQRKLTNHVKGLIFQPWPPAGKMPAMVQRRPDPWLQGSHCHLLCGPPGYYNATLKVILSVCVGFSDVAGGCQLSFFTFSLEFLWSNPALKQRRCCGCFNFTVVLKHKILQSEEFPVWLEAHVIFQEY